MIQDSYGNDRGMALPIALVFLMVLATVGSTATMLTTTDLKMVSSYRSNAQLIAMAEAGIEEGRGRLRADGAGLINDSHPDKKDWAIFIGTEEKARWQGYHDGKHEELHSSLQSDLDYVVKIEHRTDESDHPEILLYGDSDGDGVNERNITEGENIYLIKSAGYNADSHTIFETEVTKIPAITVPAPLYIEESSSIAGSFNIAGADSCGSADKPGVVSSQSSGSLALYFSPQITGSGETAPDIVYDGENMDVGAIVDAFKDMADFSYEAGGVAHTTTTTPGPGDDWGTPEPGATPTDPSSCAENNIVHYDTDGSYIVLRNGVSGCGILLVEGDLVLAYDFSWHGAIIVTGSVLFVDEGYRHITGALIAGGAVDGNFYGGSSNIVYCSSAITEQTENRPLKVLTWKESF